MVCDVFTVYFIEFVFYDGGGPAAVEFLGSGDCFDVPSHMLYAESSRNDNSVMGVFLLTRVILPCSL